MQLPICIRAPSALQVCLLQEQKIRRVESESSPVTKGDRQEGNHYPLLLDLFCAVQHYYPSSPFTAPVSSSWKPEVLYVILLLDCCRFFKSQRHFFFLSIFNGCLTNICCYNYFYEHGWLLLLHSSPWSLHSSHAGILTFLECSQHASVSGPLQ